MNNLKLKDIALSKGFYSMKDLSKHSGVPSTTLSHYKNAPFSTWNNINTKKLSKALNTNLAKAIADPVKLPFIKWVGGKRQLLPKLIKYAPKRYNTYIEPFVGGGALLFKLSPKKAIINDSNQELMNSWRAIKSYSNKLIKLLLFYEKNDSKKRYLKIRAVDRTGEIENMSSVERAARFIYLNKAGYNGLWRVNQKGQNNVPYGDHKNLNLTPGFLIFDSQYLKKNNIKIMNDDYKYVLKRAQKDDFVYLDPPYIPKNLTSNFTSYTKKGFGLYQQKELAQEATKLAKDGVKVMLSNSDVPLVSELYSNDVFTIHHVQASRSINSNKNKRGKVGEVIITSNNY